MKLSAKIHGILDYVVVAFLLISPMAFNLPALTSTFTYTLAFVHLALTALTDFPAGLIKIIPVRIHGFIELAVSMLLAGVAFLLGSVEGEIAKIFYLCFAAAVFLTWLITDYGSRNKINEAIF